MPATGERSRSSARFAVGNPSLRPRRCPPRTRPRIVQGRPSQRRRPREVRGRERRAHAELLMRSPPSFTAGTTSTPKPSERPASPSTPAVAAPVAPEAKVVAHHHADRVQADGRGARRTPAATGYAKPHRSAAPTGNPGAAPRAAAALAQARQPRRRVLGLRYSRGMGSKVTTTDGSEACRAWSTRRPSSAWWPRCSAIIGADGHGAAPGRGGEPGDSADQPHVPLTN